MYLKQMWLKRNTHYLRIKGVLAPQETIKSVPVAHLNEALDFSNDC